MTDDIVAIATPPGRGAIGIVRLSGDGIPALCRALTGDLPAPRYAKLCDFCEADGVVIDRGIALYFPAPQSYSGEHALELHAHGSPVVLKMLLRRCLELGARLARPGEFSERAYTNGRLDLAQAEAVADLIAGATEAAARSAIGALQGVFSARINDLVAELTALRVRLESAIDFPEEGVDYDRQGDAEIADRLRRLQQQFADLRATAKRGKRLRDGLKIVLTGAPNAGKSSLLNALAGHPRAIVNAAPGTTRDLLEEAIDLDGLPLIITDTAGIRDGDDEVEMEGVRRAKAAGRQADLVLVVVDDAVVGDAEVGEILREVLGGCGGGDAAGNADDGDGITGNAADGNGYTGDDDAGTGDGNTGYGNVGYDDVGNVGNDDAGNGNGNDNVGAGDTADGNGIIGNAGDGNGYTGDDDAGDGDGDGNAGNVCIVRNKIDLTARPPGDCEHGVALSALTGEGIPALIARIKHQAGFRDTEASPFIARQRHLDALRRAAAALDAAIAHAATDPEFIAEELTTCQSALGEITGEVSSDDLLGHIFSTFCIGK